MAEGRALQPTETEELHHDDGSIGEGFYQGTLKRLKRNKVSMVSLVAIILIALIAIFAPYIAPYDPYVQDLGRILQPPSAEHWLGTDDLGRDILSRIIYGARVSLTVGIIAESIALFLGVVALQRRCAAFSRLCWRKASILCTPTTSVPRQAACCVCPSLLITRRPISIASWLLCRGRCPEL